MGAGQGDQSYRTSENETPLGYRHITSAKIKREVRRLEHTYLVNGKVGRDGNEYFLFFSGNTRFI